MITCMLTESDVPYNVKKYLDGSASRSAFCLILPDSWKSCTDTLIFSFGSAFPVHVEQD